MNSAAEILAFVHSFEELVWSGDPRWTEERIAQLLKTVPSAVVMRTLTKLRTYWDTHPSWAGRRRSSYLAFRRWLPREMESAGGVLDPNLPSPPALMLAGALRYAGHPPLVEHPAGRYRLDLAYPDDHLAVEVDGAHHASTGQRTHDAKRDRWLTKEGWTVLRVTGSEVVGDIRSCVRDVVDTLVQLRVPPGPPSVRPPGPPRTRTACHGYLDPGDESTRFLDPGEGHSRNDVLMGQGGGPAGPDSTKDIRHTHLGANDG